LVATVSFAYVVFTLNQTKTRTAVLMIIEMAYFLYREGEESISFTVPDDEQDADLEAK
jgi:hypothetical protein